MNFFIDENLSRALSATLNAYLQTTAKGREAIHLLDRFPQGTPDTQWQAELGTDKKQWCVISGDLRLESNTTDPLKYLFVKSRFTNMPHYWQLAQIFRLWEDIEKLFQNHKNQSFRYAFPSSGKKFSKI